MSMWDQAAEAAERASEGGLFLTLTDNGDQAKVVFLGEPLAEDVVWTGEGYEAYDPDKHDKKPSVRIKINVFNTADNALQIWNMNATTFKTLMRIRDKYGLKKIFEITRNGKKGDPKTTYSILPDDPIPNDLAEKLSTIKLHDLQGGGTAGGSSEKNRDLLVSMLRELPRASFDQFIAMMEVKKLSDIGDDRLVPALALAKKLSEKDDTEPTQKEIDPWS